MSDQELDPAVIKATQQSLGKYIKKPPLSEKLLKKPPFRYLMDIFTAFIRETGCFEGLYTPEEQLFENINDRNDKTRFLQKMIDATKLTTKLDLKVRTSKIVAGHEPQLTNELLQAMASIIDQRLEWRDAVQQVLAKSSDKPKSIKSKESEATKPAISSKEKLISRKEKRISPQEQKPRRATEQTARVTPTEKEKPQRRLKPSPELDAKPKLTKQGYKQKSPSPVKPKSKVKQSSTESDTKSYSPAPVIPPEPAAVKLTSPAPSPKPRASKTPSPKVSQLVAASDAKTEQTATDPTEPESQKSSAKSQRSSGNQRQVAGVEDPLNVSKFINEGSEPNISAGHAVMTTASPADLNKNNNNNNNINNNNSSNNNNLNNSNNNNNNDNNINNNHNNHDVKRERENTFTRENSKESNSSLTRPRTSLRPPSARPASARPGAPRRRNVEIVLQANDQVKMSGINVKLETFGDFDDDGENLVVIEDANAHDIDTGTPATTQIDPDVQQGRLVQQILETQKELVQQGAESGRDESQQKNPSSGARQSSARQMNDLRDIIQTLTKSVNPLGKLMDFIPEDIDAMQLELSMWRDAYTQAAAELKRERSLTASATEPMKQQLLSIQSSIDEYKELVDESRHKIMQNNERILKMLMEQ